MSERSLVERMSKVDPFEGVALARPAGGFCCDRIRNEYSERMGSTCSTSGSHLPRSLSPSTPSTKSPTASIPSFSAAPPSTSLTMTFCSLTSMPKPLAVRRTRTSRRTCFIAPVPTICCSACGALWTSLICAYLLAPRSDLRLYLAALATRSTASISACAADTRWVHGTSPDSMSSGCAGLCLRQTHQPGGGGLLESISMPTSSPRSTESSGL
mmetsp:Transcript_21662/g.47357  ORF Transcript_21662/g.47357 Transcript_21662/m.47357 type:complete len:213 (+) Transcript_21662:152-790(+)